MIVGGVVLPTSIVLVPEVGRGRERTAVRTVAACRQAGRFVQERAPETLLLLLPGAGDSPELHVPAADGLRRDFGGFDASELSRIEHADADLSEALLRGTGAHWQPVAANALPEAALTATYFLSPRAAVRLQIVRIPGLRADALVACGQSIRRASELTSRRLLVAACGELSSRLFPGAPGGFAPTAPAFDEALVRALQGQDLATVQGLHEGERTSVDESLWPQLTTLIAAMTTGVGTAPLFDVLAYEAPFGVGYLVATVAAQSRPAGDGGAWPVITTG